MNYEEQVSHMLKQLESETGIRFQIEESTQSEKETLHTLEQMLSQYQLRENKDMFLYRYLTTQLTDIQYQEGLRHFHLEEDAFYALFEMQCKQTLSSGVSSVLSQLFFADTDTLLRVDDHHILLLRQQKVRLSDEDLYQMAQSIVDTVEAEAMISIMVSYDKSASHFSELPGIYHNVCTALVIGTRFFTDKRIFGYHQLGMGKLLYHLPNEDCLAYLEDNLNYAALQTLDEETLHTIHTFFDSNLSIAECARKLFLHRNTLIYRLDKIQKSIGLDIRRFDDAITCKIAMFLMTQLRNI